MKKFLITSIAVMLTFTQFTGVNAQTSTASATPRPSTTGTQSIEDRLIQTFKEKVATKVAELRKKNIKPVVGRISNIKGTSIDMKVKDGDYTAKVDESLTKIYEIGTGSKKEIELEDLEKGDYIIVDGPQLDKVVTANTILRDQEYFTKSGKITEVNSTDDYLKILSTEKDIITLDIDTTLRMQLINGKTFAIEPVTMAKVKEGDTIHFVYVKTGDETVANRFDAERILIIPQEYFQK